MKTPFWQDRHFWSAVVALGLGIAIRHAPPAWQQDLIEAYGVFAAAGIIVARRQTETQIGLPETPAAEEEAQG